MKTTPVVVIHGGAGTMARAAISTEMEQRYRQALTAILARAQRILLQGGTAVDAVTEAVTGLEDCELFNAGRGAVYTSERTHELDASIMDGASLKSGAVAGVTCVRNPVLAARKVMETSRHVFFVGRGAEDFARQAGLEMVDPEYFSTPMRLEQLLRAQQDAPAQAVLDHDGQAAMAGRSEPLDPDTKMGTVGAVALDGHGNLAAATSTGGMTNKQVGRVGDSPIIGAGCYASRICAVSCTGSGEMFIRMVAAHDIAARIEYGGLSLVEAADDMVYRKLPSIDGRGGMIAVDAMGNVAMPFNTEGMYRGSARGDAAPVAEIFR